MSRYDAQRTAHNRTAHSRTTSQSSPVVGERGDVPQAKVTGDSLRQFTLGRAAVEDRNMKARWGVKLKSAYVRMLAIPDEVKPGDHATARAIAGRVQAALDIRYKWTENERYRLRQMLKQWDKRGGGRDIVFNLHGWRRKETWDGNQAREVGKDRRMASVLTELGRTISKAAAEVEGKGKGEENGQAV